MSSKTNVGEAIQTERRRLLIDATLTAISEYGLSKLTLAKIAAEAGLTAGSVNFHFDSKEALLLETLKFVAEELDQSIFAALSEAGKDPAKRLLAIIHSQLDPEIAEYRKVAVWNAFSAERGAREDYKRICGIRDHNNFNIVLNLCTEIINKANKQDTMNATAIASGLQGIIDDIWQEILFSANSHIREEGVFLSCSFLASVFPWCFEMPAQPKFEEQNEAAKNIQIVQASAADLDDAAKLFDLYRQFYHEKADLEAAKQYLHNHMIKTSSLIYLAKNDDGKAVGFMQMYGSYCSIAMAPVFILYDLYIDQNFRQAGIGKALMAQARKVALEHGAKRIELETSINNLPAQALYEELGYKKEEEYFKYALDLY